MELERKVKELDERLTELEQRLVNLEGTNQTLPSPSRTKEIAPREFLDGYKLANDVDCVLAFGFFLEHYRGQAMFNVDDLRGLFSASKLKSPQNINDKINLNIKKGNVMDAPEKKDNKKAWTLTGKGEAGLGNLKREQVSANG